MRALFDNHIAQRKISVVNFLAKNMVVLNICSKFELLGFPKFNVRYFWIASTFVLSVLWPGGPIEN